MKEIAEKRRGMGVSQRKLADMLGVSQSTVAMWEIGRNLPSLRLFLKLADILNCTTDELLGRGKDNERSVS